jgi:hypothetical protein
MAGKAGGGRIVWTGEDLGKETAKCAALTKGAVTALMRYEAAEGQNYMRTNAPWTDRTGNARQGLFGRAFSEAKSYTIVLYHTMPYGIFLETRWSGRYAIIEPAVQHVGHNVMESLRGLLARVGK